MSTCYMITITTSVISVTDLKKILDDFGVEVNNVVDGKSGDIVVDGIVYVNSVVRRQRHNGIAEAIQEVAPSARVSTSWVEADTQSNPYYETPPKQHDVRIIVVVVGGELTGAYATNGVSVNLEVLYIERLRNGVRDFDEQAHKLSAEVDAIEANENTSMVSVPINEEKP